MAEPVRRVASDEELGVWFAEQAVGVEEQADVELEGLVLTPDAVHRLGELLWKGRLFRSLTLRQCCLTDSLTLILAKAVGRGRSVERVRLLEVRGCSWDAAVRQAWHQAVENNLLLLELTVEPSVDLGIADLLKQNDRVRCCREDNDTNLSLAGRSLTWGLPAAIFNLGNLTRLDASHCKMTSLSSEVKRMSSLTQLSLRSNELAELPAEMLYVRRLRVLDCEDNLLKSVPLCLSWLNELEVVNFRGNCISQDPPEAIGALQRLREFDLSGQKTEDAFLLPKKVAPRGEALINWCKDRLTGQQPARVRVVVLGEPSSGKTSLVRAVQSQSSGRVRQEIGFSAFADETDGVALSSLLLPKNLELKFWDFRSSLSWTVNQSFFTNGSIFIVCFDLRGSIDHSNLGFWLSLIVSRAPDARIYLCGTHLDASVCDRTRVDAFTSLLQSNFMDRVSNVRELLMISSQTGKGCRELLQALIRDSVAVREMQISGPSGSDTGSSFGKSRLMRNISSRFRKMSTIIPRSNSGPSLQASISNNNLGSARPGRPVSSSSASPPTNTMGTLDSPRLSVDGGSPEFDGVPAAFLILEQKLFALSLAVSPPVITWAQFQGLALHSGLERSQLRNVAEYLQDLGSIIYFSTAAEADPSPNSSLRSGITGPTGAMPRMGKKGMDAFSVDVENMVILDIRWLMRVFTSVTDYKASFVGQIEETRLLAEWDSNPHLFPPSLRSGLFWLLEKFQVLYRTLEGLMFAPSLLDQARPANFEEWWSQKVPTEYRPICRVYHFEFLPLGFGGTFMANVQRMGWKPLCGWKSGMVLSKDRERLLIEINPSQHSLRLNIRYPAALQCSSTLGPLAESLSTLIRESLRCSVRIEVPCLHCLALGSYDYYVFDLDDLSARMADGEYFAHCRSIHPVRIFTMAPDISVEGLDSHVIPYEKLHMGEKLGEGSYSAVHRATFEGEPVAVKVMNIDDKLDAAEKRRVFSEWRREVETMRSLHDFNIVAMRGVCLDPICMVLDLCSVGDVYHWLKQLEQPPPWKLRLSIGADVAKGMRFLHSITPPVIHRDLKSPNVLLSMVEGTLVAKVADFGLSVRFGLVDTIKGTQVENPIWTAPEVLRGEQYDDKCDVYSFGVIMWEVLTRKDFFGEIRFNSEIERLVLEGKRPDIPADCPHLYGGLIGKCWSSDPLSRPSFVNIVVVLGKLSEALGLGSDPSSASNAAVARVAKKPSKRSTENTRKTEVEIRPAANQGPVVQKEALVSVSAADTASQTTKTDCILSSDEQFTYEFAEELSPCHEGPVECLLHLSEGSLSVLWSGDDTGFVHVFNLQTRQQLHRFRAHPEGVLSLVKVGSNAVWSCCRDGSIRIWHWSERFGSITAGKTVRKAKQGNAVTCMVSEGANLVICGSTTGDILAYRGAKLKKQILAKTESAVSCLVVHHGLIWVGVGSTIFCTSGDESSQSFVLRGHSGPIHQLVRVGDNVWSVSSDKTCMVWTVVNGTPRCLRVVEGHSSRVFTCATDNVSFVWTAGWDKSIIAWTFGSNKFVKQMEIHHEDAISSLVWIPGGPKPVLISASWDGRILLWNGKSDGGSQVKKSAGVKVSASVLDHWGAVTPMEDRPKMDQLAKGLRLLGRSTSRGSLRDGVTSPIESPRSGTLSPRGAFSPRSNRSRTDSGASGAPPTSPLRKASTSASRLTENPLRRMGRKSSAATSPTGEK